MRSSAAASGSAAASPANRRARWTIHGRAANQASVDHSPRPSAAGRSGEPTYTTIPAIRARFTGKTVARRQAPSAPTRYIPTVDIVISSSIRNSATALRIVSRPHPVGFAVVAPMPRPSKLDR